jgi:hypothetical protein
MKTYTISIDPDLSEQWGTLQARLTATRAYAAGTGDKVHDAAQAKVDEIEAEIADLEPRIVAAARTLTVKRLPPKDYARLVLKHPPREGDELDQRMGVNTDDFDTALMEACIVQVEDGNGVPVDDWDWTEMAAQMPFTTWRDIVTDVMGQYDARDAVPFSLDDWRRTHH